MAVKTLAIVVPVFFAHFALRAAAVLLSDVIVYVGGVAAYLGFDKPLRTALPISMTVVSYLKSLVFCSEEFADQSIHIWQRLSLWEMDFSTIA